MIRIFAPYLSDNVRRYVLDRVESRWTRLGALAGVLVLGVSVRLFLLLQRPDQLTPDESVVGLMGLHILRGEFPVFYAGEGYGGQGYMGALQAYLAAVLYTLAGASPLTVRLTAFLSSCLFIVIGFLTGRQMAGCRGGVLCALLVAIGPPFLPVYGGFAILDYAGLVVVGSLVLLLTLDLMTEGEGEPQRSRKLWLLGLLSGLGWWINPLMLSYLAAAGICFLLRRHARWSSRGSWTLPVFFLLGSFPFWIYYLFHPLSSFVFFREEVAGNFMAGIRTAFQVLLEITSVRGAFAVPVVSAAAGLVYVFLLGILLLELGRRSAWREPEGRVGRGVQLLVLFSLIHLVAFSLHAYSGRPGVWRYLFPLYSAIPILTGIALLRLWAWSRFAAAGALVLLLLNNVLSLGPTVRHYAGDSQEWVKPIANFLQAEGLTHAYAGERIALRLTFETRERIIVADPIVDEQYRPGFPYPKMVDESPRVAYVLPGGLPLTPIRFGSSLEAIGAKYRRKDFGRVSVFYDFVPPSGTNLASLPPHGWQAETSPAGSDPARAFDRDVDTAWSSQESLKQGMWYRLDLGRTAQVGGITILPVRPRFGIPVGYRIELSQDGTIWDTVALLPEFVLTLRWNHGQPRVEPGGQVVSRFAPRPVRYIRITQTGENPREWWAIAEVFVHGFSAPPRVAVEHGAALAHLRDGIRLEKDARLGLALAAYERAIRLDPELGEAHWRMAEVYGKAELPIEGSTDYRRGSVFGRLGMWARAAREFEILLAQDPDESQHSHLPDRLLELYRRQGESDKAAQIERRLVADYTPPSPTEATFGQSVQLLGYGLAPREPRAGEELELAYYWRAIRPTPENFTVFVHFRLDGKVRFTQDHEPLDGRYPTSRWREGERVRERYQVRLPPDLPPGEYEIQIGLWNPKLGKHLRVAGTGLLDFRGRVRLTTVRVLPPRGGSPGIR